MPVHQCRWPENQSRSSRYRSIYIYLNWGNRLRVCLSPVHRWSTGNIKCQTRLTVTDQGRGLFDLQAAAAKSTREQGLEMIGRACADHDAGTA